jgi:AcrR family transcriptional regulator
MTAPGLYRYYSSREELLRHVIAQIFRELAGDIHRAIAEAGAQYVPSADEGGKRVRMTLELAAACHEFRRWALTHKDEFALLFGVPLPGFDDGRFDDGRFDIAEECALEFAGTFYTLFTKLWNAHPFPVPAPSDIDPGLLAQLGRFRDTLRTDAPYGAVLTFLRCWVLLYGAVAMEVFGHLGFALDDPAPMFEITLSDLATLVGLEYPLPGP